MAKQYAQSSGSKNGLRTEAIAPQQVTIDAWFKESLEQNHFQATKISMKTQECEQ